MLATSTTNIYRTEAQKRSHPFQSLIPSENTTVLVVKTDEIQLWHNGSASTSIVKNRHLDQTTPLQANLRWKSFGETRVSLFSPSSPK